MTFFRGKCSYNWNFSIWNRHLISVEWFVNKTIDFLNKTNSFFIRRARFSTWIYFCMLHFLTGATFFIFICSFWKIFGARKNITCQRLFQFDSFMKFTVLMLFHKQMKTFSSQYIYFKLQYYVCVFFMMHRAFSSWCIGC